MFRRRYRPEEYEFWQLATFNAERARGIVHTKEWCDRMAAEQARFNAQPHPADDLSPIQEKAESEC